MTRADEITKRLQTAFTPSALEVINDSAKHAKHVAMQGLPGGESHYTVRIKAAAFAGKSRVDCHRMVNVALQDLFTQGLHALAIEAGE